MFYDIYKMRIFRFKVEHGVFEIIHLTNVAS